MVRRRIDKGELETIREESSQHRLMIVVETLDPPSAEETAAREARLAELRAVVEGAPDAPLTSVSPGIRIVNGLPVIVDPPARPPLSEEEKARRLKQAALEGSLIQQPVVVWPSNMKRGPNGELLWG
jgi:hypothetical protein